ncbi:cytochrome C peroxidase [Actibacterium mucosum KCTC 23349]|uniref:Cytochrome C peroxidase n=1 Tax=Actibacterium mucosum KCTC 23349 TaxID=1454373 RepID=A0A037ZQB4_9RHOB|nr:cytochrome c peroxidase [Actibacterium mucosum]KAJ57032.1 cytochrome C peroxidase [Actibacterium mucosum KCTC 23349]
MTFRCLTALLCTTTLATAAELPKADAVFPKVDMNAVKVGQLLFYDPILSGNREVACATCHHPDHGTSDGVSLGLGDGGKGLGPARRIDAANAPEQRIPRNSPALFNLGATEFTVMFHDGRLEADPQEPNGIRTPLGEDMTQGFDSILSAQTMFPVLSGDEMAGHYSENDISRAVRQGLLAQPGGAWDIITARVAGIPEYRAMFDPVIGTDEAIKFTDIANALGAFIAFEWRADNSPFDQFLRYGQTLPDEAMDGMELFYGKARCADCHSGLFQTDHQFHAIAMPQIGPGKAARFETHHRDTGRMRVTGDPADAYAFRTPSLRNVAATAPYGHAGSYATLEATIRHHLNPVQSLKAYSILNAALPEFPDSPDLALMQDETEVAAIASANVLPPFTLSDAEIAALEAFLITLTDPLSEAGRLGIPESVPSGLPVPRAVQ